MFHDFDACKHNTAAGRCLPLTRTAEAHVTLRLRISVHVDCARALRVCSRIAYCGELRRELEVQDAHVHHAAPVLAGPAEPAGDARACHHSAGSAVLGCDWLQRDAMPHGTTGGA